MEPKMLTEHAQMHAFVVDKAFKPTSRVAGP